MRDLIFDFCCTGSRPPEKIVFVKMSRDEIVQTRLAGVITVASIAQSMSYIVKNETNLTVETHTMSDTTAKFVRGALGQPHTYNPSKPSKVQET